MSGYLVLRWVSLLLDVSVKSALLLVGIGAILLLLRRASAATRHLVWLLAFGSLLCLPLLSAALPGWHTRAWPRLLPAGAGGEREPTLNTKTRRHEDADYGAAGLRMGPPRPVWQERRLRRAVATLGGSSPSYPLRVFASSCSTSVRVFAVSRFRVLKQSVAAMSGQPASAPPVWPATVCLIWLAGVGAVLAQVGAGIVQVRRMARRCPRVTGGPLVLLLRELNREVGGRRPVHLRMAEADSQSVVPMTWGWRQPVVLLPSDAEEWPEGQLRSVLLHELAHVRRGDWPAQLLTYTICALYWFHPLVWLAARQIRLESERACDDRVLIAGVHGPDYAAHLLEIVRALRGHQRPLRAALTVAPQSPIERRLRSILEERRSRRTTPRWAVPLAFAIAAGTVIPLAGVRPPDPTAPRPVRQIAAVPAEHHSATRPITRPSLVGILETTGHVISLDRAAGSRPESGPRAAPRKPPAPHRQDGRPFSNSPAVPRPRHPARISIRLLAALPPTAPSPTAAKPSPRPAPQPVADPEPVPSNAVPAEYVRDDDEDKTPVTAAAALVDEHSQTDDGEQPPASAGAVQLAATTGAPDETGAASAPRDPGPDTAVLPAAGQDREVSSAPTSGVREETAVGTADDSCLRWAAQMEAAEQAVRRRSLAAQEILVWDPDGGEWVRVLLVWERPPSKSAPGENDADVAPAPAVALPEPEADPASELTEPGVIAGEMPLWEQVFDGWEKALAEQQRKLQRSCPPVPPSAL